MSTFQLLRISLLTLLLSGGFFTSYAQELTWEQQEQLTKYFDNTGKFYGVSQPVLEEVMAEHKDFFGNFADALSMVDLLNKAANAQDADVLKSIFEAKGGELLKDKFPSFSSWLGWMTWAKAGMQLFKDFVVDPAIMSSALETYMSNRDIGLDPADAVTTIRSWGSVEQQLLADFRKQYGDSSFEIIAPSGLKLLPRWQVKFDKFVVSHFEQEAAKFKIREKALAEAEKMKGNVDSLSETILQWLQAKEAELEDEAKEEEEKEKECGENEDYDEDEKRCLCIEGYKRDDKGQCVAKIVESEEDDDEDWELELSMTYPAGVSPTVFTNGWILGARAILEPGTNEEQDLSHLVRWEGSGNFSPTQGSISRPSFSSEGGNVVRLTLDYDDQTWTKEYNFRAIDPIANGFASIGSNAACPADAHGCPSCPHAVVGPAISGSPNVTVGGVPALRKGDEGIHAACCGANTFKVAEGDASVLINGKPAARIGHKTLHCGGEGKIVQSGFSFPNCEENEKLNDAGTECICEDGFERNDDDECVQDEEAKACGENAHYDETEEKCLCNEGYVRNDDGLCAEEKDDPREEEEEGGEECGDKEYYDADAGKCKCKSPYMRNESGNCATAAEVAEEIEEEIADPCGKKIEGFKGRLTRIRGLRSTYRTAYQDFQLYRGRFRKEINDESAETCQNRMVAYTYRRAKISARKMEDVEDKLVFLLIDAAYDMETCDTLRKVAATRGLSRNVSTWINFQDVSGAVSSMAGRLSRRGCYPEDVEQFGEEIGVGELDPNFVGAGGALSEIPGDGQDNDGDGQQDEIPFAALPGFNITVGLYDSGSAKDDVFNLTVVGLGTLGVTPAGGLRTYGLNLPAGTYTAQISVIDAPDNVGTFTINVLENGVSIGSLSGSPGQGGIGSLVFQVN